MHSGRHSQTLAREANDFLVIESKFWRARDPMPSRIFCIICGFRFRAIFEQRGESNAYGVTARVAPRVSECADLFEANAVKPGFFFQLARGCRFKRFALINESAGQCPLPFERRARAFDKQYFVTMKEHYVNSHRRSRVIVAMLFFLFRFFIAAFFVYQLNTLFSNLFCLIVSFGLIAL